MVERLFLLIKIGRSCGKNAGIKMAFSIRLSQIETMVANCVRRGLLGGVVECSVAAGPAEAMSRRRAVVHVIGRELQHNSVKRA